jgi:capsular polysaccharide export protein
MDETLTASGTLAEPVHGVQPPAVLHMGRADADSADGLAGRRFLIVTAPFGPFGAVLARTLERRGARVSRLILNAGDRLFWRRRGGIAFNRPVEDWPRAFRELAPAYTDVIIFGEGGAYNHAVASQAETLSARVWVLENGYFRPDWVTVERDGVNASSQLPRRRAAYAAPAPELPVIKPVGKVLPHHVRNISAYHTVQLLGQLFFPNYRPPYIQQPWLQCLGHIRRSIRLMAQSPRRADAATIRAHGPFFLVCLQREGDAQLLRYSGFADNTAFLAEVMTSFARHADPQHRLVVKNHPLDPGLVDLENTTRCLAVERGLAGRVDFIDGGNLAQLCRASEGMVVNNSSAALSALGFHTPVKVMGEAFFDFEGLTDQKSLHQFWLDPEPADVELFTRFRAHVIARTQVNGNYHAPAALGPTARALADVFEMRADRPPAG